MPATDDEMVAIAVSVGAGFRSLETLAIARADDGSLLTDRERETVRLLAEYHREQIESRSRERRAAQRKAIALLRDVSGRKPTNGCLLVVAPSGNAYRLFYKIGSVQRVTRHGNRWFAKTSYCIHEDTKDRLPPADRSIAHYLMLQADEDEFLRMANATELRDQIWNPEYLRRIRNRRSAQLETHAS